MKRASVFSNSCLFHYFPDTFSGNKFVIGTEKMMGQDIIMKQGEMMTDSAVDLRMALRKLSKDHITFIHFI